MPHHSNLAHTPFDGSEPLFRIGLRPFEPENWLHQDHCFADHMEEKHRLLSKIPDRVFQAEADTEEAQAEVLSLVEAFVENHFTEKRAALSDDMPDLLKASLLIQEDLVILRKSDAGWRLVAGSVCFPSSWSLPQKIGKPMHDVHGPVPGFNAGTRNAGMIERIFDNLQTGQPVERFNWSIYNDDALHHDDRSGEQTSGKTDYFLRVERQTLTRLPRAGDILFTIRIYIDPIEALENRQDRAEIAKGFISLLKELNAEELRYKGLDEGRDGLILKLNKLVESAKSG